MDNNGLCLVGGKKPAFMTEYFDHMPFAARAALRESKYDICAACFMRVLEDYEYQRSTTCDPKHVVWAFERAISRGGDVYYHLENIVRSVPSTSMRYSQERPSRDELIRMPGNFSWDDPGPSDNSMYRGTLPTIRPRDF